MPPFVHLHVRSHYSPLRSAARLKDIVKAAAKVGSPAVCVTDVGNLHAAVHLQRECERAGLRPIFGAELTLSDTGPLVFLARNARGWESLSDLCSRLRCGVPVSAEEAGSMQGLAVLTGGADGDLQCAADRRGRLRWLNERFGHLYAEVAPTFRWQETAAIAEDLDVPVVATGDVSYISAEDAPALDILRAIDRGERLDHKGYLATAPARAGEAWYRPPSAFRMPQAYLDEAADLADSCCHTLTLGKPKLPKFGDGDSAALLTRLAEDGLRERLSNVPPSDHARYWERLRYELGVILPLDFAGYFLIVGDMIRWAKSQGIGVGPGRGSAAGSVAVWALGITDLDPLRYGLFFERFLNPERASWPDIDTDICYKGRARVIEYLRSRYGAESVGGLSTFKFLHGKTAIKDAGRVFGLSFQRLNNLTADIPGLVEGKAPKVSWIERENAQVAAAALEDGRVAAALRAAELVEGIVRDTSVHASGIVVADGPLWRTTPTLRDKRGGLVSQCDMNAAEDAGLVKLDLLGLNNVTQMQEAATAAGVDLGSVPLDDAETYRTFAKGDTLGVFQAGKPGFRRMLVSMKPDRFGDIIAAGALYRPGPLESGMTRSYIERKHGREAHDSLHPALDVVLQDTHACIVYQEQVMSMVRILAGYSLGRADIVRKIMGKKKREMLDAEEKVFFASAQKHGVCDEATARKAWEVIVANSGYSFNLAHSAAYGLISYLTAYLKTHHPAHFYAALLNVAADEAKKTSRIGAIAADMAARGMRLLPPDVALSKADFFAEANDVRYGLLGLKGLSAKGIATVVARRPRTAEELAALGLGKRDLATLADSGALDRLLGDPALRSAVPLLKATAKKGKPKAQLSLFAAPAFVLPSAQPVSQEDRLAAERRVSGIYASGHPLDPYPGPTLRYRPQGRERAEIPVILEKVFERQTKKGEWMAILFVSDRRLREEITCFPKAYARMADALEAAEGRTCALAVRVTDEGKLTCDGVRPLGWTLLKTEENGPPLTDFLCLDLETTDEGDGDLTPSRQRIIEVGTALFTGRSHARSHSRLIDPGIPVSEGSSRVHGLRDADVQGQPTFRDRAPQIATYVAGRPLVVYNGRRFDIPVLQAEMARAGVTLPPLTVVDVFAHVRLRYDTPKRPASKKLVDQCAYFGVPLKAAHRAADDAEATGRLLVAMQDRGLAPMTIGALVGKT